MKIKPLTTAAIAVAALAVMGAGVVEARQLGLGIRGQLRQRLLEKKAEEERPIDLRGIVPGARKQTDAYGSDAAQRLDAGQPLEPAYNLGSGDGVSVGEIMATVAEVTGIPFTPEIAPRRAGDPARIVAAGDLAARDLDWRMRHTLREMVETQWRATRGASQPSA